MKKVLLLGMMALSLTLAFDSLRSDTLGQPAASPKPPGPAEYEGIAQCLQCHSSKNPREDRGSRLFLQAGSHEFVTLGENLTWSEHDLHSRAYQNLSGSLGQQMESILKRTRPADYRVTTDATCLACHATDRLPQETWAKKAADPEKAFDVSQGVSCEMCHGYASNWNNRHAKLQAVGKTQVVPWREWSPEVKAEWGMVNLRDPAVRAERCASCHVGNAAEGKFVTHEMFAAGHPPLPPLDVLAYSRDQPRHWGLPRELPFHTKYARENAEGAWKNFHYRDEATEVYAARQLAESTLATFHASMNLLDQQATNADGLDFASFDCYSCHHDLKIPSARQRRGYPGVPGRPSFRPATEVLTKIIVQHAAGMKDGAALKLNSSKLEKGLHDLAVAFGSRTYGDSPLIRSAVAKLDEWYRATTKEVQGLRYTRDETLRLLRAIVTAGADREEIIADPESAQVLTWALITLVEELESTDPQRMPVAERTALLKELSTLVNTSLRGDPQATMALESQDPLNPADKTDRAPIPVANHLRERMAKLNGFDVAKFRDLFRRLEPVISRMQ